MLSLQKIIQEIVNGKKLIIKNINMNKNKNISDFKSFHYLENGEVDFSNFDTIKSANTLSIGSYDIQWLEYPESRISVRTMNLGEIHKIHSFPDRDKLDKLFQSFFCPKISKRNFGAKP